MTGRTSARMVKAMKLLMDAGLTPYAAAQRAQIDLSTMYKSQLYKRWRDSGGDKAVLAQIRKELDVDRPIPRPPKKKQRFSAAGKMPVDKLPRGT